VGSRGFREAGTFSGFAPPDGSSGAQSRNRGPRESDLSWDLRVGLHSSQVHRDGTSRDGEFLQKGSEIHRTEKG